MTRAVNKAAPARRILGWISSASARTIQITPPSPKWVMNTMTVSPNPLRRWVWMKSSTENSQVSISLRLLPRYLPASRRRRSRTGHPPRSLRRNPGISGP